MLCGLLHRTGICGDNSTGDLLALLVSSRALESSAKVARKLPFIIFSLSFLGYFSRTNLLLPCVQLPFYNLLLSLVSQVVLPWIPVVPVAVADALVDLLRKHFYICCILSLPLTCGSSVSSGPYYHCTHRTMLWLARPCAKVFLHQ